ncbi:ECF transporter S component [Pilimelia columellifera]|uniref:ECF transporter S component n=1 Tax=Pilimelia columellifera subsp. columellifera TaxID=706583 RepID=A0ABP6AYV2_9ACTN
MRDTNRRWRTVDVLVVSVLAVAFGVVFWAWGLLWNGPFAAVFGAFKPASAIVYGVWLLPAVVGPLVIRKPGAGLFCEVLAAIVSALLGSAWGLTVVIYGLAQGIAGEAAFAALWYRSFRLPVAVAAGALAGLAAAGLDLVNYYPTWSTDWKLLYTGLVMLSAALVAGAGGWLLTRALARTGVLRRFPSGRDVVKI